MTTVCKNLTIFEGPDGGGKSTAAQKYAVDTGAKYIHFDSLPRITANALGRMYVEAMLPALMGYQDVVFDRCWYSEPIYGDAFRKGTNRIGRESARMLDRLAMRCGTVVVRCLPPWGDVQKSFRLRKGQELLDNEMQLGQVYKAYQEQAKFTVLPEVHYDYTRGGLPTELMERSRTWTHYADQHTAGNYLAAVAIVGEDFAERKDTDGWYQWPFASFSKLGCSQWLAKQLRAPENELFWINSDQPDKVLLDHLHDRPLVLALGAKADQRLTKLGIRCYPMEHPQSWMRFKSGLVYPINDVIKQAPRVRLVKEA